MKLPYFLILLGATLFVRCENDMDYDKEPCKFAPPESNFPIIPGAFCEECFFKIKLDDKDYYFSGNRIEVYYSGGDYSQMKNVFFSLYLVPPDSNQKLQSSIDVKTPLLKTEAITKLTDSPPLVFTAFGINNYCNDFFQPITEDITKSYQRLTKAELIESYPSKIGSETYQLYIYYLTGEIQATIIVNGDTQFITAEYRVKSLIYEKL